MIDLSLCLINRNDQKFLVPLIKAARPYVGEIVMVDTGSTDDSVVAALRAGADSIRSMPELMHEDGVIRSFAEARNHSYDLATCSWRLWLDADCTIDHWDQVPKTIEKATQYRDDGHPGLNLRMWIDYTWNEDRTVCCQTFTREFFTHKDDGWVWKRPIHEYLHREAGHLPEVMVDYLRVTHMSQGARNRENGSDRNLTVLKRWEANGGLEEEPEVLHYYLGDEMMSRCMFEEAFVYLTCLLRRPSAPSGQTARRSGPGPNSWAPTTSTGQRPTSRSRSPHGTMSLTSAGSWRMSTLGVETGPVPLRRCWRHTTSLSVSRVRTPTTAMPSPSGWASNSSLHRRCSHDEMQDVPRQRLVPVRTGKPSTVPVLRGQGEHRRARPGAAETSQGHRRVLREP